MNKLSIKQLIKDLLPPILLKLIRKHRTTSVEYSSYEKAMEDANGYEDSILTKVVVAKGKIFADKISVSKELNLTSMRTFIALASVFNCEKKLSVIDFGGAAGTHYFIAKSILPNELLIDWRVVETTQMVNEAKEQGLETSELKFFDSLKCATKKGAIDLVFASGSLHYTPEPYEFLKELTLIDAKKLMITRTPITDTPKVLLQRSLLSANGVGEIPREMGIKDKLVSYPTTMMDRNKVEEILGNFGDTILKIKEDETPFYSERNSYDMWGYVVSRRD